MKSACKWAGTIAGYLGTIVCIVSVAGRFYGEPVVFGWAASHVLLLGTAILAFACWSKLEAV